MQQFIPRKKRNKFNFKSGDVFGRLTFTGLTYTKSIYGHFVRFVEAVCVCGEVRDYTFHLLASGQTQSCGCLRKENTRKRSITHNLSNHKLYDVWQKMVDRCCNSENKQYKDYGGRGIEVWLDWKKDFYCFYEWCIENGYEDGLSLDRVENDGFYAPYNCKFSTREEQNRNTRRNRMFTAFGETKCLFDWGKDSRCVISIWGLRNRVDRGKWPDFEKALTTPLEDRFTVSRNNKRAIMLTAFGETKNLTAWLEDERCKVKLDSLRERIKENWNHEKAISTPPRTRLGIKNK